MRSGIRRLTTRSGGGRRFEVHHHRARYQSRDRAHVYGRHPPAAWPGVAGALAMMRAIVASRSVRSAPFPFPDGSYRHGVTPHLHQLHEHRSKHPCELGSEPVVERRGHQRLAGRTPIGATKPRQGALGPGAESEHHAPEHRAGVDFAPASHRPALTRQTLDLRLRQQAGQRLANTNKWSGPSPRAGAVRRTGPWACDRGSRELQHLRRGAHAALDLVFRRAGEPQGERHVSRDVHVRIERVRLKDHRDVARLGRCARHVPVADADGAAGDRLQARHHPQRRRLPATGRTHDDHELALADVERELRDHHGGAVRLHDVVDLDSRQGTLPDSAHAMIAPRQRRSGATAGV